MARKLNCWEFKNCGREKGGLMVGVLGECPVASGMKFDGVNDGIAAGRACWEVSSCGGRLSSDQIGQSRACHTCEFYRRVLHEEEENVQCRLHSMVE